MIPKLKVPFGKLFWVNDCDCPVNVSVAPLIGNPVKVSFTVPLNETSRLGPEIEKKPILTSIPSFPNTSAAHTLIFAWVVTMAGRLTWAEPLLAIFCASRY